MGYMRHHTIVVSGPRTSFDGQPTIAQVQQNCKKLAKEASNKFNSFNTVSAIVNSPMNDYASFFVAPDGSKEGWDTSEAGDALRDRIVEYLNSLRYSDGSTSYKWVEVQFGDDNGECKVTRSSDD